jgi:hypothetical protein
MARASDTINFQGFDLILPEPVRGVCMVKFSVFISLMNHTELSSLLPVHSTRADQLRKLFFATS